MLLATHSSVYWGEWNSKSINDNWLGKMISQWELGVSPGEHVHFENGWGLQVVQFSDWKEINSEIKEENLKEFVN